jgi:predicted RecA/RadA family phage recombinase
VADMVPFFFPADTLTCHASAAVTGQRLVGISGARTDGNPTVAHAAGADFGVAARDAAAGGKVTVFTAGVLAVQAGGVVAAGARVAADANGQAVTATGAAGATVAYVGRALDAAAAAGDVIPVFIDRGAYVA